MSDPPAPPTIRTEPFRIFFPLGVILGWAGIGHWLLYATGLASTYSCETHGLVQTQAFLPAFGLGFLLTAIPRRTRSAPASGVELTVATVLPVLVAGFALAERRVLAEIAYVRAPRVAGPVRGHPVPGRRTPSSPSLLRPRPPRPRGGSRRGDPDRGLPPSGRSPAGPTPSASSSSSRECSSAS